MLSWCGIRLVADRAGRCTAYGTVRWNTYARITQRKAVHTVNLPGKQTVLRLLNTSLLSRKTSRRATPDSQYPGEYRYRSASHFLLLLLRLHLPAVMAGNSITRVEHHAVTGESLRAYRRFSPVDGKSK